MPDALSKTIPIWCTIINRALFENHVSAQELYTPNDVVGESEHAQIKARLDGFSEGFRVNTSSSFTSQVVLSSIPTGFTTRCVPSPRYPQKTFASELDYTRN